MTQLSVVVVSFNPPDILAQTLEALSVQIRADPIEGLVVGDWTRYPGGIALLQERYSDFTWIESAEGATIPNLRANGWAQSRGELVAFIEDDCIPAPGWCEALIRSHETNHVGIGGVVLPAPYQRPIDWAVYFCEYARFMPPIQTGDVDRLAGNHLSYKKARVEKMMGDGQNPGQGYYEAVLNPEIIARGLGLKLDAALTVRNIHRWEISDLTRAPFHHGRGFAGQRRAGRAYFYRLVYAAGALFLPALLTLRAAQQVYQRNNGGRKLFLRSLHWILVFNTSWALGELTGALFGEGASLSNWK